MTKTDRHDAREYYLTASGVATADVGSVWFVIPVAGYITQFAAGLEVLSDGDPELTFFLGGVAMESGGSAAALTLPNTDVVGSVDRIEFDRGNTEYALEPENLDLVAAGGVFEVRTDGDGSTGNYSYVVSIRP
jgi:hypothetical protein